MHPQKAPPTPRYPAQTASPCTALVSGTGHAGMEACVANLIERGDKILIVNSGIWGDRVADMAGRFGAQVVQVKAAAPGQAVPPADVIAAIHEQRPAVAFLVQGESSTGVHQSLAGVGAACREAGSLLVVDTVASLGGVPFFGDAWLVDAAYAGSQKVLSAPPGAAPLFFGPRALAKLTGRASKPATYQLDLNLVGWGGAGREGGAGRGGAGRERWAGRGWVGRGGRGRVGGASARGPPRPVPTGVSSRHPTPSSPCPPHHRPRHPSAKVGNYWGWFEGVPRAYHHTGMVSTWYGLREALAIVAEEGLPRLWARHAAVADRLWAGLQGLGLEPYAAPGDGLITVNTIAVPAGVDAAAVCAHALAEYNLEIAGGLGPSAGQAWRVGVMGYNAANENVDLVVAALRSALAAQGWDKAAT